MKKEISEKERLVRYIKKISAYKGNPAEFDWKIYEWHKRKIKEMLNGDYTYYDWAIEKLTEKLGI